VAQPQVSIRLNSFSAEDPGGWESLFEHARLADAAGVDRVAVSDHVVFGEHMEEYARPEIGGWKGGQQPTGPDGHWLEPLTVLASLCGVTRRVRLGTSIVLAALRRPVVLAKAASTIDALSGGRLDLGVGVGWQKEEYEAAGLDFANRGRLLDHTLEVCHTLWREQRARYQSDELRFEAIHMMPKPLQPGGVPIWVSGTVSGPVVKRLARFGSGWIPWGPATEDLVLAIKEMKGRLTAIGSDPTGLQVLANVWPVSDDGQVDLIRTMRVVPGLIAGGVTDFHVRLDLSRDSAEAQDQLVAMVTAFRKAAGQA
jgi:probable F420-dependent oxidoreductase